MRKSAKIIIIKKRKDELRSTNRVQTYTFNLPTTVSNKVRSNFRSDFRIFLISFMIFRVRLMILKVRIRIFLSVVVF